MVPADLTALNPGQGVHVSLSPFDMRATLIAAGPDFRSGMVSDLPSGNIDIAPTVLWILGIAPPKPMDGRVLLEALTIGGAAAKSSEHHRIEAKQEEQGSLWHQYLEITTVAGVEYIEEGNGSRTK